MAFLPGWKRRRRNWFKRRNGSLSSGCRAGDHGRTLRCGNPDLNESADGDYVLVDWWFGENMLQHSVYATPMGCSERLTYVSPEGVGFCVWELVVFAFEREAWIETVLMRPAAPNLDAYLGRYLNTTV